MDHATHNKIVSFIWSIADDCLRDVFVRGKYRDVILPMFVLRRIDCLLEDTKYAVLAEVKFQKNEAVRMKAIEISKMAGLILQKIKVQDSVQYSDLLQATGRSNPLQIF